ncbi:Uncharacterized zinc protease y4wA [Azospirillaceae bacterium]
MFLSSFFRRRTPHASFVAVMLGAALTPLLGLSEASATARRGVYFPETFMLNNGMQVVTISNHRVPVVTHMVWYKVGAADEPLSKSGLAHFLEHLMFKGTDKLGPGEFNKQIARNGGQDNAFTSWDYTTYFQTVASDRLEMVMTMEADRMTNLRLSDDLVDPERSVILEERRQRSENDPRNRLGEVLGATRFVRNPYGIPVIGWEHEIKQLTRSDEEEFYRKWYAPNNAILVVAGDIDVEKLKSLAEKVYGGIPARALPNRTRPSEPPILAERRVTLRDSSVQQPTLERSYRAPSHQAGNKEFVYPLQLLTEIMSGGSTGRLYKSLVVDQNLATSAWLSYSPLALNETDLTIGAAPTPGGDLVKLETALIAEIRRLTDGGVTAQEVVSAKKRLIAAAAYARDSLSGPAFALGNALATGLTIDDVERWPERIDAVTIDQVNAAARAVLNQPDVVTGLLLPEVAQ